MRSGCRAQNDLSDLSFYVASTSGSAIVAERSLDWVLAAIERIGRFPERGRLRPDLASSLRIWPFERRVVVAYAVRSDHLLVTDVFARGRDLKTFHAGPPPAELETP